MPAKPDSDLFIKFMAGLVTAAAIKMSLDLGEIKTTVAVAVVRINSIEARMDRIVVKLKEMDVRMNNHPAK